MESQSTRTDIQVLRGFAVLIVLLYHAKLSLLPAGYLGVDVFFVISGFLITGLIKKGIERGSFTFLSFYFRRAKRLLPAAYVTFLVTALLAPFFLTAAEMQDFRAQMIGAVTFTANMVLWRQSGYFEGAAELKPFLHVWSLAIEEQYYFILPAMLVFVPRRFWMAMAVTALVISGALCILLADRPAAQFFLLPTRGWELMIGSVGALLVADPRRDRWIKAAFWPALIVLLALPCVKLGRHPGPQALAICIATLLVILRNHPVLSKGFAMRGMGRVGDMSYSLYLVHWPIFAFFNNAWIGETARDQPIEIRIGLVVLSLVLAWLLHIYIEEPIRHANIEKSRKMLVRTLSGSFGLVLLTAGIAHAFTDVKDYVHIKRMNNGFGLQCEFLKDFEPIPACRNSEKPEVLVWGDSFAMHLVPGIASRQGVLQATRSICAPLRGNAVILGGVDESWAKRCIQFNESVLAYLKTADSIKTVVLSSPFHQQVSDDELVLVTDLKGNDPFYRSVRASIPEAVEGIRRTAEAVKAMGKQVVIIAPPPSTGFDIGRCVERMDRKLVTLSPPPDCQVRESVYRTERRKVLEFLAEVPKQTGVQVISFDDYLCKEGRCRTVIDGTLIYRDTGHLSHDGSVFLAKAISLREKISTAPR
ncbi:MAG TPA: acyltransferase family protein [Ramlibacter sp.]|nr:acyltransferase family protein [Ramlibacter sp.]